MSQNRDPWFDLSVEERRVQYAARKAKLDEIAVQVRLHRLDDCEGAPLCPGGEAGERLSHIRPWEIGEFVATCLAHIVDDQEEIDNLRVELDRARDNVRQAEAKVEAAERDAEAGWTAFRAENEKHRTGR
jgi:hypothetical protein